MKAKSKIAALSSFAALALSPLSIAEAINDGAGNLEIMPIVLPTPALPDEECVVITCPIPDAPPVLINDGETVDEGGASEVEVSDGEVMSGEVAEGEIVEKEITDGEITEGEVTEGEPVDGFATESPTVDEPVVLIEPPTSEVPIDWLKRGGETPEMVYHTMADNQAVQTARPELVSPLKADIELGQEDKGAAIEMKGGQAGPQIEQEKKGPVALVKKGRVFLR